MSNPIGKPAPPYLGLKGWDRDEAIFGILYNEAGSNISEFVKKIFEKAIHFTTVLPRRRFLLTKCLLLTKENKKLKVLNSITLAALFISMAVLAASILGNIYQYNSAKKPPADGDEE